MRILRPIAMTLLLVTGLLTVACTEKVKEEPRKLMFWPPSPDAPRIQFLVSISNTADVTGRQTKTDELLYGKDSTTGLPFMRPYGVRFHDGKIYVCDATAASVTILDLRKKEVRILGRGSVGNFSKPIDIAVAEDGARYVADTGHGAVLVYDAADNFVGKIGGEKMRPVSLAVYKDEVYVTDLFASQVRVFDRFKGKELRRIGEVGRGEGKVSGAMGIALDKQGNIYISDVIGCRVQKFAPDGKLIWAIGGLGDTPGKFVRPKHLTVDSEGILYAVDAAFQNVQMFNEQGQMLMFFGSHGEHPGAMSMPTGVCVSDGDLDLFQPYIHPAFNAKRIIIVTNNMGSSLINIYALGELKPGKTLADIADSRVQGSFGLQASKDQAASSQPAPVFQLDTTPTTAPRP